MGTSVGTKASGSWWKLTEKNSNKSTLFQMVSIFQK